MPALRADNITERMCNEEDTWNAVSQVVTQILSELQTQQGKQAQLASEARRMKLGILGEHKLPSGQVLLYSGIRENNAPRDRGVGFPLSAQAHVALIKLESINERIIIARFKIRDKENFYSELNAILDKIPKGVIKIYMGNFNAKIGSDNTDYESVIGRHGLGEMSENGELLAEFCGNNDMVIEDRSFPINQCTKSRDWSSHLKHDIQQGSQGRSH
ncbi:craniofacial development protein 2-like [Armigeres subalbatus]|uniref:craniofacial development protein 2-like n=1 Tax=Armigeres subalbatus TaxID=124917 RepID=UPI002ED2D5B9